MRCCWFSCSRRARWFVTNTWDGVLTFVVCNEHMIPMTNAYPDGKYVLGILNRQAKNRKSNDTTD